ncbi:MAG TPA: ABC transporter substrate-binding protein [Nocardioidaceae bacterium]|jgi:osmoprotectant transport system substrate-binding protein|nr:ABC transporter substrate-binding protein [Nocardioidaceae bacterium]
MPSKTKLAAVAATVAVLLPLSACGGNPTTAGSSGGSSTIAIGSANFPENELLAEMYAQALEAKGVTVQRHLNIGARERYLAALKDGSINMVPEYNGALLAALSKGGVVPKDINTADEVNQALKKVLPAGTEILQSSPAEDKDTLSVMPKTAAKYHLKAIPDLKPVAGKLVLGGPPEFAKRYQGVVGLKSVYGVVFKDFKPLDVGGPLTKAALTKGDIDVANIFSTDPAIRTDHFVVLADPKNLFGAQNVTPVIAKSKASSKVVSAINAVSAALTTKSLTKYLTEVQVDKKDPASVAKEFLDANNLD